MSTPGRPLKVHPDLALLFHVIRDEPLDKIKKILHTHGINSFDPRKRSALNSAAYHTRLDVIQYLISEKADLNHQDKNGLTSLHWAVAAVSLQSIKLLLSAGTEIDKQNEHGSTALFKAVSDYRKKDGELEIIRYLIDVGANIKKENDYKNSPLSMIYDRHLGACEGHINTEWDLFFILSEEDQKNILLHIAQKSNFQVLGDYYHDELKIRIENGMDVNSVNAVGNTLLCMACLHGNLKAINLLLDHGADIERSCEDGMTALAFASKANVAYADQWKCKEAVELLIANGANINVKTDNGKTLLALAAENGRLETVEFLIEKGLNVNEKDNNGKSVLDLAKKSFHEMYRKKVVAILKKNGAI